MTRQGVLWDLDAVLVDTGEFHYQAWSGLLPEYGIPFTHESFRATFGMNNAGILATLLGHKPTPELLAEISDRKEQRFREAVQGRVQPLPGVLAWLERLKAAGLWQAIASSAPPENIDALVVELGLRAYFEAIVSGFDLPGKPDPPLGVAIHAVDLGRLKPGMTVGAFGCGLIGLLVLQVARAAGATHIIATDKLPHRLEAARSLGATAVFQAAGGQESAIEP